MDLFTANGSAIEVWHVSGLRVGRGQRHTFDAFVEAHDAPGAVSNFSRWLTDQSHSRWQAARVDDAHRCHTIELMLADWTAALIKQAKGKTT